MLRDILWYYKECGIENQKRVSSWVEHSFHMCQQSGSRLNQLVNFDVPKNQVMILTSFSGEGLDHVTRRSTPGTVAGSNFNEVLGVRQQVLEPGRVLLAGDLNSVCSCFLVVRSPVSNLQISKRSDTSP